MSRKKQQSQIDDTAVTQEGNPELDDLIGADEKLVFEPEPAPAPEPEPAPAPAPEPEPAPAPEPEPAPAPEPAPLSDKRRAKLLAEQNAGREALKRRRG